MYFLEHMPNLPPSRGNIIFTKMRLRGWVYLCSRCRRIQTTRRLLDRTAASLAAPRQRADAAREDIWEAAREHGREPKVYLHWSAGHYFQKFGDYHVNITGDGKIYVSSDNLADVLAHTYYRNSGSVGISLCCCAGATTSDLGDEPPTPQQIEAIAQAACAVADGLWLTIDREHVMTHGEAADNADGLDIAYPGGPYGPQNTCERWDLQYLGTDESGEYTTDYDDPATGGNVLRGKANWYRQHA